MSAENSPRFTDKRLMKDITQYKPEKSPQFKPLTVKKKASVVHRQKKTGERIMRQHQVALQAYELFFYMEEEEEEEEEEEKPFYKEIIDGKVVYKYTKPEPKKY